MSEGTEGLNILMVWILPKKNWLRKLIMYTNNKVQKNIDKSRPYDLIVLLLRVLTEICTCTAVSIQAFSRCNNKKFIYLMNKSGTSLKNIYKKNHKSPRKRLYISCYVDNDSLFLIYVFLLYTR